VPAGIDGSGGLAFVWPIALQTDATNDTLGNLSFDAIIHLGDIPIPAGQTLANLKTALRRFRPSQQLQHPGIDRRQPDRSDPRRWVTPTAPALFESTTRHSFFLWRFP
jgi:hypothetical protein